MSGLDPGRWYDEEDIRASPEDCVASINTNQCIYKARGTHPRVSRESPKWSKYWNSLDLSGRRAFAEPHDPYWSKEERCVDLGKPFQAWRVGFSHCNTWRPFEAHNFVECDPKLEMTLSARQPWLPVDHNTSYILAYAWWKLWWSYIDVAIGVVLRKNYEVAARQCNVHWSP